jgi:hypothetical protein
MSQLAPGSEVREDRQSDHRGSHRAPSSSGDLRVRARRDGLGLRPWCVFRPPARGRGAPAVDPATGRVLRHVRRENTCGYGFDFAAGALWIGEGAPVSTVTRRDPGLRDARDAAAAGRAGRPERVLQGERRHGGRGLDLGHREHRGASRRSAQRTSERSRGCRAGRTYDDGRRRRPPGLRRGPRDTRLHTRSSSTRAARRC